ncbi:MAG: 30S ribosomal protein S16 [Patescibacteria group bacterium]|nr:MAG: 30S ribosomal protein S16 [Patescibacteria group bacterium]
MSAVIRLTRLGRKNRPFYRIVVMDKRRKRESVYIDKIGHYDPFAKESEQLVIDSNKLNLWLTRGVELSEGVRKLWKKINRSSKAQEQAKKNTDNTSN